MPTKKAKFAYAYAEWGVECPYCGIEQPCDEGDKYECAKCGKVFKVPEEVGDITKV